MQLEKRIYDLYLIQAQHELALEGEKTKQEIDEQLKIEKGKQQFQNKIASMVFGRFFLSGASAVYSYNNAPVYEFIASLMENLNLDEISFETIDEIIEDEEFYDKFYNPKNLAKIEEDEAY